MTNTWIVGVIGALVALFAIFADDRLRSFNAAVALWLFISAWILPVARGGTTWNNVVVALVLFALSMQPGGGRALRHA
jgi:hypothetical protein